MSARRIAVACLLGSAGSAAFGCVGASSSSSGGGGGGGGGDDGGSGGTSTACAQYFDAYVATYTCTLPLPASEITRLRPIFAADCAALLALPGTGSVTTYLEACAAAVQVTPCALTTPAACNNLAGTLAAGAPCVDAAQCSSGTCTSAGSESADGGTSNRSACGTCSAAVALGSACGDGTGVGCEPGAACPSTGASPSCVSVAYVAAGAPCDGSATLCEPASFCDPMTQTCVAPAQEGGACSSPYECVAALACGADDTCVQGGVSGEACDSTTPCAKGLGCDSTSMTCAELSWANGGDPCDDATPCLVGGCVRPDTSSAGTCPTVVPDGQPCPTDSSATCDTFSSCINGVCALEDSAVCN